MKKTIMILATIGVMAAPMNVNAQEVTTDGSATMEITAERSSYYTVAVPESIDLATTKTKDFQIQAKGNLSPTEQLKITVGKDVAMTRADDSTYTGTGAATLDGAVFTETNLSESYTSKTGNVTFNETKAGNYTGILNFTITVENTK